MTTTKKPTDAKSYLVTGPGRIEYPDGKGGVKEAFPGDVVVDLPLTSIGWLVEQGEIVDVESIAHVEEDEDVPLVGESGPELITLDDEEVA